MPVEGRTALLPEFSFIKSSRKSNRGTVNAFSGVALLKMNGKEYQRTTVATQQEYQRTTVATQQEYQRTTVATQHMLLPNILPFEQLSNDGLRTTKLLPEKNRKQNIPQTLIRSASPIEGDITRNKHAIKFEKSQDQNIFTKIGVRDITLNKKSGIEGVSVTTDGAFLNRRNKVWRNELNLPKVTEQKLNRKTGQNTKVVSPSKRTMSLPTNLTPQTEALNQDVTVTMKSVGTPRPIQAIPYCSWIDQTDCPDVSKLPQSCIESLTIPASEGECKMCPFNWCSEPNDIAGNVRLHDPSSAGVVLNTGRGKMFAVAVSQQNGQTPPPLYVKTVHKTTTEIPFWNFETFGP